MYFDRQPFKTFEKTNASWQWSLREEQREHVILPSVSYNNVNVHYLIVIA